MYFSLLDLLNLNQISFICSPREAFRGECVQGLTELQLPQVPGAAGIAEELKHLNLTTKPLQSFPQPTPVGNPCQGAWKTKTSPKTSSCTCKRHLLVKQKLHLRQLLTSPSAAGMTYTFIMKSKISLISSSMGEMSGTSSEVMKCT